MRRTSFLSRCMDLGTCRSSGVPDRFVRHAGDDPLYLFDAGALRIDIAGDHLPRRSTTMRSTT